MVPAPRFPSWEAFNEQLEAQCLNNRKRRLRRHTETIEERFKRDRQALLPLPPTPYDACDKRTTRVTTLSGPLLGSNSSYGIAGVAEICYVDEAHRESPDARAHKQSMLTRNADPNRLNELIR